MNFLSRSNWVGIVTFLFIPLLLKWFDLNVWQNGPCYGFDCTAYFLAYAYTGIVVIPAVIYANILYYLYRNGSYPRWFGLIGVFLLFPPIIISYLIPIFIYVGAILIPLVSGALLWLQFSLDLFSKKE